MSRASDSSRGRLFATKRKKTQRQLRGMFLEPLERREMMAVIDDQDASGFTFTSGFNTGGFIGYNSYMHYANGDSSGDKATWTFTGLSAGTYRVAATWPAASNAASNAPFTVKSGGNVLGTAIVNQRIAPDDAQISGTWWEDLGSGVYTITGSELTVELTDQANEHVRADAVRIDPWTGPEAHITTGGAKVEDNTGSVDFGTAASWWNVEKTFMVKNVGVGSALSLGSLTIPSGFTLVSGVSSSTLQPGESTSFTVRLDTATAGTKSGQISLVTNDGNENPYNFAVTGLVNAFQVIDDMDASGFTYTSGFNSGASVGYNYFRHHANSDGTGDKATWTFANVPDGTYRVSATWNASTSNSPAAAYTVRAGSTVLGTATANQTIAPNDAQISGTWWEDLGTGIFTVSGGTVSVELSDQMPGTNPWVYAIADAVRLESWSGPEVHVTLGGLKLDDDNGAVDFGTIPNWSSASKTFTVQNVGTGSALSLGTLTIPSGFTLVSGLGSTTLQPGQSTTFSVRLDTATAGTKSGQISLVTNDGNENPFNFAVTGVVNAYQIADDLDTSTFTYTSGFGTGGWIGYASFMHYGNGDNSGDKATWTFNDLPLGAYRISASWPAASYATTAAPYTIRANGVTIGTNSQNQQVAPNDFLSAGVWWEDLGAASFVVGANPLTVEVRDQATNFVLADAIRLELLNAAPTAVNDSFTVDGWNASTVAAAGVLTNDTDREGNNLTVSTVAGPAHGTLTWGVGGGFTFTPSRDGATSDSFTYRLFDGLAYSQPASVTLSLGGLAPEITVTSEDVSLDSGDSLSFGETVVGAPVERTLVIHNGGTGVLSLYPTASSVTGDFSWVSLSTSTLAPGANATLIVNLPAAQSGQALGQLSLSSNDGDEAGFTINLVGDVAPYEGRLLVNYGTLPLQSLDSLPEAETTLGTPVTWQVAVTNGGTAPLSVHDIVMPNGFSLVGFEPSILAVNEELLVTARLDADSIGYFFGSMIIHSDDPRQNDFEIVLDGTVVPIEAHIDLYLDGIHVIDGADDIRFGEVLAGEYLDRTFTVVNNGNGPLSLAPDSLSLPPQFSLTTQFPGTIAPHSQATFTVRLQSPQFGNISGAFEFGTNDPHSLQFQFAVAATAFNGAIETVTPLGSKSMFEDEEPLLLDLSNYFRSPTNGSELSFTVSANSNPSKATSEIWGNILAITPQQNAHGSLDISITASGSQFERPTTSLLHFTLAPVNDPPIVSSAFSPVTVNEGSVVTVNLASHFLDQDNDALQYSVDLVDHSFGTDSLWNETGAFSVSGGVLTIHAPDDLYGLMQFAVKAIDRYAQGVDYKASQVATTLWVRVNPVNDPLPGPLNSTSIVNHSVMADNNGVLLPPQRYALDLQSFFRKDVEDLFNFTYTVQCSGNAILGTPTATPEGILVYTIDNQFSAVSSVTINATDRGGATSTLNLQVRTRSTPETTSAPSSLPPKKVVVDFELPPAPYHDPRSHGSGPLIVPVNDDYDRMALGQSTQSGPFLHDALSLLADNDPGNTVGLVVSTANADDEVRSVTLAIKQYSTVSLPLTNSQSHGTVELNVPEGVRVWVPASWLYHSDVFTGSAGPGRWIEYGGQEIIIPFYAATEPTADGNGIQVSVPLLIEGLRAGEGSIVAFFAGSAAPQSVLDATLDIKVGRLDVDIDSNNDGTVEADSASEDEIELDFNAGGKRIIRGGSDRDMDGIVDRLDGFNRDGIVGNEDDITSATSSFVPLEITIPEWVDLEKAMLVFRYSDDDPRSESHVGGSGIRLWKVNEASPRNFNPANSLSNPGDFIASSSWHWFDPSIDPFAIRYKDSEWDGHAWQELEDAYSVSQLGGGRIITLYVEPVTTGNYSIQVGLDPDGIPAFQRDASGNVVYATSTSYPLMTFEDRSEVLMFDAVEVTVVDVITIVATDAYATEPKTELLPFEPQPVYGTGFQVPPDKASFTISRGDGNVGGDLLVYYKLVIDQSLSTAADPAIDFPNRDFLASRIAGEDNSRTRYDERIWWWEPHFGVSGNESLVNDTQTGVGIAVIPTGRSTTTITIDPRSDSRVEWDESVTIQLISEAEYRELHDRIGLVQGAFAASPNNGAPSFRDTFGALSIGSHTVNMSILPTYMTASGFGESPFGNSPTIDLYEIGPGEAGMVAGRATVKILDNDGFSVLSTRNMDSASTQAEQESVDNGVFKVNLLDGSVIGTVDLGSGVPSYRSNDNLQPIIALEFQLPLEGAHLPTALSVQLTVAQFQGEQVSFDVAALRQYLATNPLKPIRILAMGPANLAAQLSTGSYDIHADISATVNGVARLKTLRGSTEIVNRVDRTLGTAEFGERWWVDDVDRLIPTDGITPFGNSGSTGSVPGQGFTTVSDLASRGAITESRVVLVRGDNTTAVYRTLPAGTPRIVDAGSTLSATELASRTNVALSNLTAWRAADDYLSRGSISGKAERNEWIEFRYDRLTPGKQYQLFVSFNPGPDYATNAPFTVVGAEPVGGFGEKTVLVNQRITPGAYFKEGRYWRSIGFFVANEPAVPNPSLAPSEQASILVRLTTQTPFGFADGIVGVSATMLVDRWTFTSPLGGREDLMYGEGVPPTTNFVSPTFVASSTGYSLFQLYGDRLDFTAHGLLTTRQDRNDNRVLYTYDDRDGDGVRDELISTVAQGGLQTLYGYFGGTIHSITDFANRETTVHISSGLIEVQLPAPGFGDARPTWMFSSNAEGLLTSVSVIGSTATPAAVIYRTDTPQQAATVTNPDSTSWSLSSFLSGISTVAKPGFGELGNREPTGTPLKQSVAIVTDPRQNTWKYQLDPYGRKTAEAKPATASSREPVVNAPTEKERNRLAEEVWLWYRNRDGQVTTEIQPPGGGGYGRHLKEIVTVYEYVSRDPFSLILPFDATRKLNPDATIESWSYSITHAMTSYSGPALATYGISPDARGNAVMRASTPGQIYAYTPPPLSIIDTPGGLVTSITTERSLNGSSLTPIVQTTEYYAVAPFTGLPWRSFSTYGAPLTGDVPDSAIVYSYDDYRNLKRVTTGGVAGTEFVYNALDQLRYEHQPDPGTGQHGIATKEYTYDADGNLSSESDFRDANAIVSYEYDGMHRRRFVHFPAPGPGEPALTIEYTFDANGNIDKQISHLDGDSSSVSVNDRVIDWDYDARNLLQIEKGQVPFTEVPGAASSAPLQSNLFLAPSPVNSADVGFFLNARPTREYRYDAAGQVRFETDARNLINADGQKLKSFQYTYDTVGRLLKTTFPKDTYFGVAADTQAATYRENVYDANGRVHFVYTARGALDAIRYVVSDFNYDNRNRLTETIAPADAEGRRLKTSYAAVDAAGFVTSELLRSAANPVHSLSSVKYFDEHGRLAAEDLPDLSASQKGLVNLFAYDSRGNLVRKLTYSGSLASNANLADKRYTAQTLDAKAAQLRAEQKRVDVEEYCYDGLNRLVRMVTNDPDGPGAVAGVTIDFEFDKNGNVVLQRRTFIESGAIKVTETATEYDALNRPTRVTLSGGGRSTETKTQYTIDGNIRLLSQRQTDGTEPIWQSTETFYDLQGRPYAVVGPESAPGASRQVAFTFYDAIGNTLVEANGILPAAVGGISLIERVNSVSATLLNYTINSYDALNRLRTTMTWPSKGSAAEHQPVLLTAFQYFADGNVKTQRESFLVADGGFQERTSIDFAYDDVGRLTFKETSSPKEITVYAYDDLGHLRQVIAPALNETEFERNNLGQVTKERIFPRTPWSAPDTSLRSYEYSPFGELTKATDRLGRVIEYVPDNVDRTITKTWKKGASDQNDNGYTAIYHYNAVGQMVAATDWTADPGGGFPLAALSDTTFGFDSLQRLNSITRTNSSWSTAFTTEYEYDALGHVVFSRRRFDSSSSLDFETRSGFDGAGRLSSVIQSGLGITSKYLSFDNRLDKVSPDGVFATNQYITSYQAISRFEATTPDPSAFVASTAVARFKDGRVSSVLNFSDNARSVDLSKHVYQYGPSGDVASVSRTGDSPEAATTEFDGSGQLTQYSGSDASYRYVYSAGGSSGETDGFNRVLDDGFNKYSYDAEGNVIRQEQYGVFKAVQLADGVGGLNVIPLQLQEIATGFYRVVVEGAQLRTNNVIDGECSVTLHICDGAPGNSIAQTTVSFKMGPWQDGSLSEFTTVLFPVERLLGRNAASLFLKVEEVGFSLSGRVSTLKLSSVQELDWDFENRLVAVRHLEPAPASESVSDIPLNYTVRYVYDAIGNRVLETVEAASINNAAGFRKSEMFSDGGRIIGRRDYSRMTPTAEYSLKRETVNFYSDSVDQLFATDEWRWEGTVERRTVWALNDEQGTPRDLVRKTATGLVSEHLKFDPFGQPKDFGSFATGESADVSKLASVVQVGFAGQSFDEAIGLYFDGTRYYSATGNRYLSEDPLGVYGGDTNLYRVARNSGRLPGPSREEPEAGLAYSFEYDTAFEYWYGVKGGSVRAMATLQAIGALIQIKAGAAGVGASPATLGASGVAGAVAIADGADDLQTALRMVYSGEVVHSGKYRLGLAATGSENAAAAIELAVGIGMPGVEDLAEGAKLLHAAKRVGVTAGFAGAGFAIGASGSEGSWERGLQYGGVGALAGHFAARYAVACFTAGTPILVSADGKSRPVDELREGDLVLARSEHDPNGPLQLKRIEEVFTRVAPVIELVVRGRIIGTTAEHPFFVVERQEFVPAGQLKIGEAFLSHDGQEVVLDEMRDGEASADVYNFRVANHHTYFIGGEWGFSLWVHNSKYIPQTDIALGLFNGGGLEKFAEDVGGALIWRKWEPKHFGFDDFAGWDTLDISTPGEGFFAAFSTALARSRTIHVNMDGVNLHRALSKGMTFDKDAVTSWEVIQLLASSADVKSKMRFHNVTGASGILDFQGFAAQSRSGLSGRMLDLFEGLIE